MKRIGIIYAITALSRLQINRWMDKYRDLSIYSWATTETGRDLRWVDGGSGVCVQRALWNRITTVEETCFIISILLHKLPILYTRKTDYIASAV